MVSLREVTLDAAWRTIARVPRRLLPGRLRSGVELRARFRETLAFEWKSGDAQQSVPPDDERISVHAVWGVEFYTPMHARSLVGQLERLGFDDAEFRSRREKISDYVRRQRAGTGESWLNLGLATPIGSPDHRLGLTVRLPLPSGTDVGSFKLHTLTSSLTALVVMFVLNDDASLALDRVLRRADFEARGTMRKGTIWVDPPNMVKAASIKDERRALRGLVGDWIADNLPGAFTGAGLSVATADFITTEDTLPLDESTYRLEYMEAVGLTNWTPEIWQSPELQNVRLTVEAVDDSIDETLTFAARLGDVDVPSFRSPAIKQLSQRDQRWALAQYLDTSIDKDVLLWAALRLLVSMKDRLSTVRDQGRRMTAGRAPIRLLRRIGDDYLRNSLEARTIAAELEVYARSKVRLHRNAAEWQGVDELAGDFLENIRHGIRQLCRDLLSTEERVRDGLVIQSTLISAVANLRVQRLLILLTVLTVAVGVVAIFVAIHHHGH